MESINIKTLKIFVKDGESVIRALRAAFVPFASLTTTSDEGQKLAAQIFEFFGVYGYMAKSASAAGILETIWGAETDDFATVTFHPFVVKLTTPHSGTEICLSLYRAGFYELTMDFGPQGSETRAGQVLSAAGDLPFRVEL